MFWPGKPDVKSKLFKQKRLQVL